MLNAVLSIIMLALGVVIIVIAIGKWGQLWKKSKLPLEPSMRTKTA